MKVKDRIQKVEQNPIQYVEQLGALLETVSNFESEERLLEALTFSRALILVGKHLEALETLTRIFQFCKENHSITLIEVEFYASINLGVIYRELHESYIALNFYENALNLSYELEDFSQVIEALIGIGSAYIEMENVERAKEYFEKAMLYESQLVDYCTLSQLYNNYAYVYILQNKLEEAMALYVKAKEIEPFLYKDESNINKYILELNVAELYFLMGAYFKSKSIYEEILKVSERLHMDFLIMECCLGLSKIAEMEAEYEVAYTYYKRYEELKNHERVQQSDEDVELVKKELSQIAIKNTDEIHLLRNIALENKSQSLQRTLRNLARVSSIGQKLVASLDIEEIFNFFKASVCENPEVDVVTLALLDRAKGNLIFRFFEERGKRLPVVVRPTEDVSTISGYVINHNKDLLIKNYDVEHALFFDKPSYNPHGNGMMHSKSMICCRLLSEEACMGVISIQSYISNAFTDEDFEVFKALAGFMAIAIANAQKRHIIENEAEKLKYLSYHDSLTGLKNRRAFNEALTRLYDSPIGLIVGDMNGLKKLNDTHGHMFGDAYLKRTGQLLKALSAPYEVYRLAGDEFAVLVQNQTEQYLGDLKEKILEAFAQEEIEGMKFSISLGHAMKTSENHDFESVFALAESNMYDHKRMESSMV